MIFLYNTGLERLIFKANSQQEIMHINHIIRTNIVLTVL
jgi:hypothetical protein